MTTKTNISHLLSVTRYLCVVLCVLMVQKANAKNEHYITVNAAAVGIANDIPCIYVGESTSPTYGTKTSSSGALKCNGHGMSQETCKNTMIGGPKSYTLYFFAKPVDNWLWLGWFTNSADVSPCTTDYQYNENFSTSGASTTSDNNIYTRYAKWVQPKVKNVNHPSVTITDPNQTIAESTVLFQLEDDQEQSNYTYRFTTDDNGFTDKDENATYGNHTYTRTVAYTPCGVHGTYTAKATLTSNYVDTHNQYPSQTSTITMTEDYTPTFSVINALNFGTVSTTGSARQTITPSSPSYAAQHGAWTTQIRSGQDAEYFSIADANATTGVCDITFAPRNGDRTYSAVLVLQCDYTDNSGKVLTYTQEVALSGTGYTPKEATLAITPDNANPGTVATSGNTIGYTYPAQYGTVERGAAFSVGYTYLSTPTCTWTGNDAGIFRIEQGTPQATGAAYAQSLTVYAKKAAPAVEKETTYTATLTISGNSTIEGETKTLTKTINVSVTLHPKKSNTLAWALDAWNTSSYVLYTDQANHPAFKDRNNTTTPIVFSSTQKDLANYIRIDTAACTLSPVKMADQRNLTATQPASDEYEGATLTTTIHVKKHNFIFTYPQIDPTRGNGTRLYRNTHYEKILSTNSIDAGEATGFSEFRYYDADDDGKYGQTLIANPDGTYGMQTGDLTTPNPYLRFVVNIPATANYLGHEGTTNNAATFLIIKDPIHVPTGPGSLSKFSSGEYYGLWLNNAYDMYGSTFKVSEYKATWIGYDWDNTTKQWTGTNTGRTDWTIGGNGYGSTNAFALEDGGNVVFHFRGVPMYTSFTIYSQTAANNAALDGTVKIEESKDGITWTETTQNSTSATYLSTAGGKGVWMKGESQYIRFSYTGSNHVVIRDVSISENNYIRTDFTTNSTTKEVVDANAHEFTRNADGTWKSFNFTLRVANWGKNGIQWTTDNPDFELEFIQPTGTGLDEYKEIPTKVRYKGDKYFDQVTLKLFTRDFYSKTSTDTLRSLTFTIKAIGSGATMPQTITNETKNTKYITGTVGPLRNSKTDLRESNFLYSETRGSNPHTGLNEQDFSSCFDTDGTPLFDKLYIFGITTNNDGTTERYTYWYIVDGDTLSATGTFPKITAASNVASNAVTPCYVYNKNGNGYTLAQTIDNMNVASKPIPTITENGKYYFSGHCPSASAGWRAEDMGVLHFKGSNKSDIQIYLENCWITSRAKSENGISTANIIAYASTDVLTTSKTAVEGSGAVIVLESTSNSAFTPSIHIKGENRLKSNIGCTYKVTLTGSVSQDALAGPATQSSAPIHIYPATTGWLSKKWCPTTLTIDDLWPISSGTNHTNGGLQLRKQTNQSPSIDLGCENSVLHINGGRINLHNAWPASEKYPTSFAISCRKYSPENINAATLFGVGGDYDGGEVHFNDGTISVLPLDLNSNATYAAYYRDGISIKCPSKTKVDGGCYISSIWACTDPTSLGASPTNQWEDAVVSTMLPVNSVDPETGLATITFPQDLKNTDETDQYYNETLENYYKRHGQDYGRASLSPNDSNYVQLLLPAKYTGKDVVEEKFVTPWALIMPEVTVNAKVGAQEEDMSVGGDRQVDYSPTQSTNFLLFTQMDNNIRQVANTDYKTPIVSNSGIRVEATIKKIDNSNYADVLNTEDYAIEQKLYFMRIVTADTWFSMVAPFDISNVYVLETYPNRELLKPELYSRSAALAKQGVSNMDFAYCLAAPIQAFGGATQDLNTFVSTFLQYGYGQDTASQVYPRDANTRMVNGVATPYYPSHYTQANGYSTNYRGQHLLTHYDGSNASEANYFLYHSTNKKWEYDGKNFKTDWQIVGQPVQRTIGDEIRDVLMQQGEIYALQFPYKGTAEDPNERTEYDYWSGKFILFEGYGPQTLRGKDAQAEQLVPCTDNNSAELRGNMTLAALQVPNYENAPGYLNNAFFQISRNSFLPSTDQNDGLLVPGGVFLLANPNSRSTQKMLSIGVRNGEVAYSEEETPTGMPTIAGGHTLLVSSQHEGLVITALQPQQVYIYGATGQLLASQWLTGEMLLSVPQGMYLVRGEKDEAKAIVQ